MVHNHHDTDGFNGLLALATQSIGAELELHYCHQLLDAIRNNNSIVELASPEQDSQQIETQTIQGEMIDD